MLQTFRFDCCLGSAVLLLCLISGCGGSATQTAADPTTSTPLPTPGPAPAASNPLGTVVFLGDSLTAGEQNSSLNAASQAWSYPAQLSAQAGIALTQPLIVNPGVPAALALSTPGFPWNTAYTAGTSTGRVNPLLQANNLAVPEQKVADLVGLVPIAMPLMPPNNEVDVQTFTNLVLGYPAGGVGSQLTTALTLAPTTIFLCIGANDLTPAIIYGDPSRMTPVPTFASAYSALLSTLATKTGAHLIVANLPDVTQFAYLTASGLLAQEVATVSGQDAAAIEADLGLGAGDLVNAQGLSIIQAELPAIEAGSSPGPLPASAVLNAAEVATTETTIAGYNQVIAQQVAAVGGTLVDLHSFYNTVAAGLPVDGRTVKLAYMGGFFSVDGVHPDNTGYALIANQFIQAANAALSLSIAPVNVDAVAQEDPLF